MRNPIFTAAVFCFATGMAYAQAPAQPQTTQPASPPTAAGQPTPDQRAAAATESQAKAKIESEGYSNVTELKKVANGKWSARAMKAGKSSQISLDTNGRVTESN